MNLLQTKIIDIINYAGSFLFCRQYKIIMFEISFISIIPLLKFYSNKNAQVKKCHKAADKTSHKPQ